MEIKMKDYNLESFKQKDFYTWEEIIQIIEELESEKKELEEKIENMKQDVEDNYKRISNEEQFGIYDKDFI